MAAGVLPQPGTRYGPCKECAHRDCAATRANAEAKCRICGERIGYDNHFYDEWELAIHGDRSLDKQYLVHAWCAEEEIEKEQAAANRDAEGAR